MLARTERRRQFRYKLLIERCVSKKRNFRAWQEKLIKLKCANVAAECWRTRCLNVLKGLQIAHTKLRSAIAISVPREWILMQTVQFIYWLSIMNTKLTPRIYKFFARGEWISSSGTLFTLSPDTLPKTLYWRWFQFTMCLPEHERTVDSGRYLFTTPSAS